MTWTFHISYRNSHFFALIFYEGKLFLTERGMKNTCILRIHLFLTAVLVLVLAVKTLSTD